MFLATVAVGPLGGFTERLADAIRRAIIAGHLRPGTRVPSTRGVARRLGVSRGTVQSAYQQLAVDGWLEGREGIGSFVSRAQGGPVPRESHSDAVVAETGSEEALYRTDLQFVPILRSLTELTAVESVLIAMRERNEFRVVAASGQCTPLLGTPIPPGLGLCSGREDNMLALTTTRYGAHPRAFVPLLAEGIQSVATVPVVVSGQMVGCVSLCSPHSRPWQQRTRRALEDVAQEFSRTVIARRPLQEHLDRMYEASTQLMGLRHLRTFHERLASLLARLAPDLTLWVQLESGGGPAAIACAVRAGDVVREGAAARPQGSAVAVPLFHGQTRVGAFLIGSSASELDLEIVRDIAKIAGDALAEIRSAEEARRDRRPEIYIRRLEELIRMEISAPDESNVSRLLQRIVDSAREVVEARYAALLVVRDGSDISSRVPRFIHSGLDAETTQRIGQPPTGRGLLGVALGEEDPLRLRDLRLDARSVGFPRTTRRCARFSQCGSAATRT